MDLQQNQSFESNLSYNCHQRFESQEHYFAELCRYQPKWMHLNEEKYLVTSYIVWFYILSKNNKNALQ